MLGQFISLAATFKIKRNHTDKKTKKSEKLRKSREVGGSAGKNTIENFCNTGLSKEGFSLWCVFISNFGYCIFMCLTFFSLIRQWVWRVLGCDGAGISLSAKCTLAELPKSWNCIAQAHCEASEEEWKKKGLFSNNFQRIIQKLS